MPWEPEKFAMGDTVIDPDRVQWGIGRVVEVLAYPLAGQKLQIEWANRGLVVVFTAQTILKRCDESATQS